MIRVDTARGPWIALVGAGPGDPDLLTRRAEALLGAADVVLHDWLVGDGVLALARPGARLIDVGKAKGRGSCQRHIEQLMVAHHGEGARVVRLKGGDPSSSVGARKRSTPPPRQASTSRSCPASRRRWLGRFRPGSP